MISDDRLIVASGCSWHLCVFLSSEAGKDIGLGSLFLLTHVLALVQIDDQSLPAFNSNSDFCFLRQRPSGFRLLQEERKGLVALRRLQLDLFLHFANVYELSRHKFMLRPFLPRTVAAA